MLGLRFCARAFSSCGERGPLFIAVHGPLTIAACLVAEHRLQTPRLSSCGSRAQLFCGMWDLPRPGLEPVSPALAGGFSTTAPPGKPKNFFDRPLLNHFIGQTNSFFFPWINNIDLLTSVSCMSPIRMLLYSIVCQFTFLLPKCVLCLGKVRYVFIDMLISAALAIKFISFN